MIALLLSAAGLLLCSLVGMAWIASPDGVDLVGPASPRTTVWLRRLRRVLPVLFGGFLLLGWAPQLSPVRALDRIVGQHLHRVGGSSVALALERLVRVGDPHPLVYAMLLAALLCYGRGHASTLRFVAFMIVGTFALELGFKSLFHYVRPGSFLGLDLSGYPSGTAMRATVLAGALLTIGGSACHRTWQRGILVSAAVGWPLVVAVALVLSGDHTPSEVVGGLLIGTVWLGVCLRLAIPARE